MLAERIVGVDVVIGQGLRDAGAELLDEDLVAQALGFAGYGELQQLQSWDGPRSATVDFLIDRAAQLASELTAGLPN